MWSFEEKGNRSTWRKPLIAEKRTNKLNPHLTPHLGIEPGPHWWEASALTTAPSLHPKCLSVSLQEIIKHKISHLPREPHISLDGHSVERVNTYKGLGLQVDETLLWDARISEVINKVAKALAALWRLRQICPQRTLVTIYESLILPHLDYCSTVSGRISTGFRQKLEKLQNRAARIMTGSR